MWRLVTRRKWHLTRWWMVALMLGVVAGVVASTTVALAHSQDSGAYTVTLQLVNPHPFDWDTGTAPSFEAVATGPSAATPTNKNVSISITDGANPSHTTTAVSVSASPKVNGTTTEYDVIAQTMWSSYDNANMVPSTFTAVAYYDAGAADAAQSGPLTFTVNKAPTSNSYTCDIANLSYVYTPGQQLQLSMSADGTVPLQDGTYTITISGQPPVSGLKLDANDEVTVTAPTTTGNYSVKCTFSGTTYWAAATSAPYPLTVSSMHTFVGATLDMNPTTLQWNTNWLAYVQFKTPAGAPAPTGYFGINVDRCDSSQIKVGANGATLVKLGPVSAPCDLSKINVFYFGDPYYKDQSFNFPRTNPAIPSVQGSASGSSGGGTATTTATTTATVTATAQGTTSPTTTPQGFQAVGSATTPTSGGGGLPLWLLGGGAFVLVVLLAGAGGLWLLVARRKGAADALSARERPPSQPPDGGPTYGPPGNVRWGAGPPPTAWLPQNQQPPWPPRNDDPQRGPGTPGSW